MITRKNFEILELPSWEKFVKFSKKNDKFYTNIGKDSYEFYDTFGTEWSISKPNNIITLAYSTDHNVFSSYKIYEQWEMTKVNYLEVCKLCEQLFVGKKIIIL